MQLQHYHKKMSEPCRAAPSPSMSAAPHDIFLSHSGAQKGFVKGLHEMLSPLYNTFFDIDHHSLPPGEKFPPLIFEAAKRCRLAVVVLSKEFVTSKWPMLELCAFVAAAPSVKILPLFFHLTPSDLKIEENATAWINKWEGYAKQDPRINVSEWKRALKTLDPINGLIFNPMLEGELIYSQRIVSCVLEILHPAVKFSDRHVYGKDRLCKIIIDVFKEMELRRVHNVPYSDRDASICVLGMHGVPGSGKSTLCRSLHDHFFPLYQGRALYMQLPSSSTSSEELMREFKKLLNLTNFNLNKGLDCISDVTQMETLQKHCFIDFYSRDPHPQITVHDVYLEFAMCMQENHLGCWMNFSDTDVEEKLLLRQQEATSGPQLRAATIEVGQGCKQIDLQGFSGLIAVVIRDCKSLAVLGMAGLSGLVILEILNCPKLEIITADNNSLQNLKRLRICTWTEDGQDTNEEKGIVQAQQEWKMLGYLSRPFEWLRRVTMVVNGYPPAPQLNLVERVLAYQMRGLQVLRLEKTGIRRLINMSNSFPLLLDLRIIEENCLEALELGNLPRLKYFQFGDWFKDDTLSNHNKLKGIDLLRGCPNLEQVVMSSGAFADGLGTLPSSLLSLQLSSFNHARNLTDLASYVNQSVEGFRVCFCEKLGRVNFSSASAYTARITRLELAFCCSLVEVTGLESLASLWSIGIRHCPKLQTVIGLDNLTMLEDVDVFGCPELLQIAGLNGLVSLRSLVVKDENFNRSRTTVKLIACSAVENLTALTYLHAPLFLDHGDNFSLSKLVDLEEMHCRIDIHSGSRLVGMETLEKFRRLSLWGSSAERIDQTQQQKDVLISTLLGGSALSRVVDLELGNLSDLESLDGIECLNTLPSLTLTSLRHLTIARGLESLYLLRELYLRNCPLLEELPSIHALVNMEILVIEDCEKLKDVEGCEARMRLRDISFRGCKNLGRLPALNAPSVFRLSIEKCGFASIEAMVVWASDFNVKVPQFLRKASLCGLVWEYYNNLNDKPAEKKRVVEGVFGPRLLHGLLPNDYDSFDCHDELVTFLNEASPR